LVYSHEFDLIDTMFIRDLKLENIMFDNDPSDPMADIKIIDFGLATKFLSNEYKQMTARVGTLYSMAPQVLQGVYDAKCDMWSVGVVAYMLLSGGLNPFWGPPREMSWDQRKKIMIDRIMRCEYMKMKGPSWKNISPEAKSFVQSLIQMNPKCRPTAAAALQSPWLVKYQDYQPNGMPVQDQQYAKKLELKRSAKVLFAQDLPADQIVQLKDALEQNDPKKEDRVSIRHFRNALLQSPQLKKSKVESLFEGKELDMGEHIDYVGMLNDALDRQMRKHQEFIVNIFRLCGTDVCCKIPKDKLRSMLAESSEAADASFVSPLNEIIDQLGGADGEEDGSVSCQAIVERIRQLEMERMNDVSSWRGRELFSEEDGEDTEDLVDENNAWIPGGRSHDPYTKPKFIYDDLSMSVRKYREGEDGDDVSESLSTL
jgi:calcium-dependent protein kinase